MQVPETTTTSLLPRKLKPIFRIHIPINENPKVTEGRKSRKPRINKPPLSRDLRTFCGKWQDSLQVLAIPPLEEFCPHCIAALEYELGRGE
jgi:hypothetical protein